MLLKDLVIDENYVPVLVDDVEIIEIDRFIGKGTDYLIVSRKRNRSIKVNYPDIEVLGNFLNDLKNEDNAKDLFSKYGNIFEIVDIVKSFYKIGLTVDYSGEINNEIDLTSKNLLKIPLKKISNCEKSKFFANTILRFFKFLFLCLIVIALLRLTNTSNGVSYYLQLEITHFQEVFSVLILSLILRFFFIIFHEIGHIVYALSKGIEIDSINISLKMGFNLIFFVRYRSLFYANSKNKFYLMMSGVIVNLFLSILFFLLNILFPHNILLLCSYINLIMVLSNLAPYNMNDGYFACLIIFNKSSIRLKVIKNLFTKGKSSDVSLKLLSIIYIGLILFNVVVTTGIIFFVLNPILHSLEINTILFKVIIATFVLAVKFAFIAKGYNKLNEVD